MEQGGCSARHALRSLRWERLGKFVGHPRRGGRPGPFTLFVDQPRSTKISCRSPSRAPSVSSAFDPRFDRGRPGGLQQRRCLEYVLTALRRSWKSSGSPRVVARRNDLRPLCIVERTPSASTLAATSGSSGRCRPSSCRSPVLQDLGGRLDRLAGSPAPACAAWRANQPRGACRACRRPPDRNSPLRASPESPALPRPLVVRPAAPTRRGSEHSRRGRMACRPSGRGGQAPERSSAACGIHAAHLSGSASEVARWSKRGLELFRCDAPDFRGQRQPRIDAVAHATDPGCSPSASEPCSP